ncbi:hypothetical protein TSMEX_002510 [Taenia solium]|eukprot:TsM_000283500 transcript=TsM_000283500 gene=TsM_000283500
MLPNTLLVAVVEWDREESVENQLLKRLPTSPSIYPVNRLHDGDLGGFRVAMSIGRRRMAVVVVVERWRMRLRLRMKRTEKEAWNKEEQREEENGLLKWLQNAACECSVIRCVDLGLPPLPGGVLALRRASLPQFLTLSLYVCVAHRYWSVSTLEVTFALFPVEAGNVEVEQHLTFYLLYSTLVDNPLDWVGSDSTRLLTSSAALLVSVRACSILLFPAMCVIHRQGMDLTELITNSAHWFDDFHLVSWEDCTATIIAIVSMTWTVDLIEAVLVPQIFSIVVPISLCAHTSQAGDHDLLLMRLFPSLSSFPADTYFVIGTSMKFRLRLLATDAEMIREWLSLFPTLSFYPHIAVWSTPALPLSTSIGDCFLSPAGCVAVTAGGSAVVGDVGANTTSIRWRPLPNFSEGIFELSARTLPSLSGI